MPSFSIPLTGLQSDNTALNTIANNLANMSTTAFKSQTTNFADLLYQHLGNNGAGDPLQVGAGVGVASTETNFTSGPITSTGNANDMAINGNGFFVVQNTSGMSLTRAGNFSTSDSGNLIDSNGDTVMGYPASGGVINTNASLTPIVLPIGQVEAPRQTSQISLTANLDANATPGTVVPGTITVYDSLGGAHDLAVSFTNTAPNTWSYNIAMAPGQSTGASGTTGTLSFDSNGNLNPTPPIPGVSFSGLADGANDLSFTWNTQGANGNSLITQVAGSSGVNNTNQDGYKSGQYNGYSVSSAGVVSATFDNGQNTPIGQLAIASVGNEQGLQEIGGNLYSTNLASGQAVYGAASTGGRGAIQDSFLEGSNVDISSEFSNLIVAQRAFEASSKAITTFDTVTQETINMIH